MMGTAITTDECKAVMPTETEDDENLINRMRLQKWMVRVTVSVYHLIAYY